MAVAEPEEWRAVVGYEGRYEVSTCGRVWSVKTQRVLRPAPTSKGYLSVVLYDGSSPKNPRSHCVHDLVMAAFVGPKPDGMQVDHGDLGKQCNFLKNLEYVTGLENVRRAEQRGLNPRKQGTDSPLSKLTADQVREIRSRGQHEPFAVLAREFRVDPMTISNVARGRSYRNVK